MDGFGVTQTGLPSNVKFVKQGQRAKNSICVMSSTLFLQPYSKYMNNDLSVNIDQSYLTVAVSHAS